MKPKISIFTTITRPEHYQYAWREALDCYLTFADEVIVICGHRHDDPLLMKFYEKNKKKEWGKLRRYFLYWPRDWNWSELPKHLNLGLKQCSGDIIIKMDIDYIIHEEDFSKLYKAFEELANSDKKVGYFVKKNILNKNFSYQKAIMPIALNAKFKNEIMIGNAIDKETDWCQLVTVDNLIEKTKEVPNGFTIKDQDMMSLSCNIWNYDYFFRTKEMAKSEFWRFAQAYSTIPAFKDKWGKDEKDAWNNFINQMKGRLNNHELQELEEHPKFIHQRICNMKEEEFGYSNWSDFKDI